MSIWINSANAQNETVHLNVSNSSGCNWTVTVYDGAMNSLQAWTVTGAGVTSFCVPTAWTASVEYVTVDDGTCVLNFGSGGGSFPYTLYNSPCGGTTCSSSIDCSGGIPSICSPPATPTSPWLIIRIN